MSTTGDVWEYFQILKESLLQEIEGQDDTDDEYLHNLKKTLPSFCDMFANGITEYSVQCNVCKTVKTNDQLFSELILYFDESYHQANNAKESNCTLQGLLESYNSRNDSLQNDCVTCKRRTQSTAHNRVLQYPQVLCIAISRGSTVTNTGLVTTAVNYPIDTFKPTKYNRFQQTIHEVNNTNKNTDEYYLVAVINRDATNNEEGHFTSICKQHISGHWYNYDDSRVTRSHFSKLLKGICIPKVEFQRRAALLFYIKKQLNQEDANIQYDATRSISTHNSRTTNLTTPPNATNDRSVHNMENLGQFILFDYDMVFFFLCHRLKFTTRLF